MNILREVALGQFYFRIAKLLRETIFLSIMLLNSDTWNNMSVHNIEELEKIDRVLIRRIFETGRSVPVPILILTLGSTPVTI